MAGTFFDVLLPSLAQAGGQAGLGALQGMTQGPFMAEELRKQKDEAAMRALQLMLTQRQVKTPQPFHYPQGSVFGVYDPQTGRQNITGQVPLQPHPKTQAELDELAARADRERAQARYYGGSGLGIGATADQRNAAALKMSLKDYLDYKRGLTDDTKIPPKVLTFMADQALAGDTSVFTNLGRGVQGGKNVVALRNEIQRLANERGLTGKDMAASVAEFMGVKAGERTLGTRTANIEMAVSEAQQMIPLALQASEKVNRTSYPTLNSVILAAQQKTGDENVVRLGIATNSLINIYARAINPTGVPTVSDKEHARELLANAWSKGQYKAGTDQLMLEMNAARQAPGIVRKEFRSAVTGKGKAQPKTVDPELRFKQLLDEGETEEGAYNQMIDEGY